MYSVEICCVATESYTVANWRERERKRGAARPGTRTARDETKKPGHVSPKVCPSVFFFSCAAQTHTQTPPPHSRVVCWWASPPSSPLEGGPPAQRHTTLRGLYRGHAPI